jgi:hypothetical protein
VKLEEPWIGYDRLIAKGRTTNKVIAEKIASRVEGDGYTAEEIAPVIAYERQELNRPEVIEALEAIVGSDDLVAA